jgi:putative transposase
MIDSTHKLSIAKQAKTLGIARSTVYYKPAPISDSDLALMAAMDRLHLDYPFAGARMLREICCDAKVRQWAVHGWLA